MAKAAPRKSSKKTLKAEFIDSFSRVLTVAGICGVLFFAADIREPQSVGPVQSFAVPTQAQTAEPTPQSDKKSLAKSEPVQVSVPSVGISANVQQVGKKEDGSMETPPLNEPVTGWYKLGPTPGEIGPSIIVGHVDTYRGPSVFYALKDIKPEEIIEVKRADGSMAKFKVTELQQFEQNNFPTDKVYGNIDHAGIRLITCGGVFNQQTQSYTHNTVVFGELVE